MDLKLVKEAIDAGIEQYKVHMKTKALVEEYKKLSKEQGKLQFQSAKLGSVVEGLKKVRKTLLVSMGMMVLLFALF